MENPLRRGFFGRQREMSELRAALDDVAVGRGRMLLISGEPGIGKTRLADEFAALAANRALRVAWGRCWEGAGAPPYWPWIQIIKAIRGPSERLLATLGAQARGSDEVEEPAEAIQLREPRHLHLARSRREVVTAPIRAHPIPTDPDSLRLQLFSAVNDLLKESAESEPLALVLDDLHDADLPSLLMLRFVARELRGLRAVIVGTYREVEVERSPVLRSAIGSLLRDGLHLPLRGLSEAEAAALVRERASMAVDGETVAALHRGTGGNPLFLDGVVQTLSAQGKLGEANRVALIGLKLPDGVRSAIRARLEMLSEPARALLSDAAMLGNQFESSVLLEVTGMNAEKFHDLLDEASLAGILGKDPDVPGRHTFGHALIRAVLYESRSSNSRIAVEAKIGAALEKLYGDDADAQRLSELAHHFAQAAASSQPQHVEKAIHYARRAGEAAMRVVAYEDVINHYETALALIGSAGRERDRAELLARVGSARLFFDLDSAKGIAQAQDAIRLFDQLGLRENAARVHADLALKLSKDDDEKVTDMPRAMFHFQEAERVLAQSAESEALAWLYMGLSVASWKSLDVRRGLDVSMRGMEVSRRLNLPVQDSNFRIVRSHNLRILRSHLSLYAGRLGEAFTLTQSLDASHPILRARMAKNAGELRWRLWEPREAARRLTMGTADPNLLNIPLIWRALHEHLLIARVLAGELELAREIVEEARGRLTSGLIALYEGDWRKAQALFDEAVSNARASGAREREADSLFWQARVRRVQGEASSAMRILEDGLARFADGSLPLVEMWLRPELALMQVEAGLVREAESNLARCREIVAGGEDWRGLMGHLARSEAVLADFEGRLSDAEAGFAGAIRLFEKNAMPWERAETHLLWGRRLIPAGRDADGRAQLERAAAIYSTRDAGKAWIERALAESREPSHAAASVDSIFRRETEYWTLAYCGKVLRLRDSKGLQYIANLLSHPGQELAANEVAGIVGSRDGSASSLVSDGSARIANDLGDAGEVLDSTAKAHYRRRLGELREELSEAERNNDSGRAQSITGEIRQLEEQLSSALGLGGRSRRARSHSERARWMVTNSIKRAIAKIETADPAFGRHLRTCIRTGNFCSYSPDPDRPVTWRF